MTGNELMLAKLSYYDHSYNYSCNLYDNLPYRKTYELCNEHTVRMYSGNIIKFFQYELEKPFLINNHDDEVAAELENMRLYNSVVADSELKELPDNDTDTFSDSTPDEEQLAQLLQDTEDTE